jgi:penicillin-binding protein 1C
MKKAKMHKPSPMKRGGRFSFLAILRAAAKRVRAFMPRIRLKRSEIAALIAAAAFFALAGLILTLVPDAKFTADYSLALYDKDGLLLGASIASDGQWRFPPPERLPEKYRDALIVFEDKRFYLHPGIDPARLLKAFISNARANKVVSGGSTITMQVARLSRQGSPRSYGEKAIEALMALRLELTRGKESILRLYSANAPYGGNVVGIDAAAWRYFGRSAQDLSWAEAAALAVLPNNPGLVHPGRNRDELKRKRDRVLDMLRAHGRIDGDTLALAKAEPLPTEPYDLPRWAPHLLSRAKSEGLGPEIETSLDSGLQRRVSSLIARRSREFSRKGIRNAACVVLDTRSGKALAYVGNVDSVSGEDIGQDVDAAMASRSSGSLLKPFLFAAMVDSGELYPQSLVLDIPVRVGSYSPENISKTYLGAVPADQALARSLNVPAVRELREYGVERFARLLCEMGLSTLTRKYEDYGLPLILGGAEANLWEMTGLYASLARCAMPDQEGGGARAFFPPGYLAEGRESGASSRHPVSRAAAFLALEALSLGNRPEEEGSWAEYASSRKVAWKTGTSFGNRDAWAIGVTPDYCVGVWIGNADGEGRPELKSVLTAAPVLFEIVSGLPGSAWFEAPESEMKIVDVCADSGFPAGPDCERVRQISMPLAAKVVRVCPYCRTVQLSEDGKFRMGAGGGAATISQKRFVLPPAVEYYYRAWNFAYRPLPPFAPGRSDGGAEKTGGASLSIIFPENGSAVYIPIELSGAPGQVVFQAAHRDQGAVLFWHVDDIYLGSSRKPHKMELRLPAGKHKLMVMDESGERLSRSFEILNEN